ncbi:ubiquitin domain-containing protein 7SL RNA1-like [Zingiber officinale]|uniref:ubiquitin domain-containing protein 7SL RNA1-like n=1 Tax=Zingiber officinale TaxID=94328 RepID=UPI001C4B7DE4|nr:ubiquitin domain-containing protein 7SL RNA1-like [Zingiber officinale]
MDLIFETSTSKYFSIEVGFFDTVLEIKEKVNKDHGYPISNQKLYFRGQELIDDRNIEQCGILQNSLIYLMLSGDDTHALIKVIVNEPLSKQQSAFEAYANETVANFKHRIRVFEAIPTSRFVVFYGGNELHEHRRLEEYGITDSSIVNLVMRPYASSMLSSNKLKVMVRLRADGTEKIPVEVNALDNVSELRREIRRLELETDIVLPPHGYFFIHKENAMEEEKSFMWHDVKDGDTIVVFDGFELKLNL